VPEVFAVWLALLAAGLGGVELYARQAGSYLLGSWTLTRRDFLELADLKIHNRRFYRERLKNLGQRIGMLESFDSDSPHPGYLFKPNLKMARRGQSLVPAAPGEKPFWSSNSWGFRGPEFRPEKPRGVVRIVCLGASTTEGTQGDDETWPHYLQQELRERYPGRDVEVINAGHHAQNIDDLYEILLQKVLPVRPDVVIFYEVSNNVDFSEFMGPLPCKLRFGGADDCRWMSYPGWSRLLRRHSAAFTLLAERFDKEGRVPRSMPHGFYDQPPKPSAEHYQEMLRRLAERVRSSGARAVLSSFVVIAHEGLEVSPVQSSPLFRNIHRDYYPLSAGELARIYAYYNALSRAVASELGVPYVDAAAEFPKDARYFPYDIMHLSPEGNRLLARIFARHLADKVLPAMMSGKVARRAP